MKVWRKVAAVVVVLSLVFAMNASLISGWYNEEALFGSFSYKKERAMSIDTQKVIVVGGSATNLGFDCKTFEELSGKPAVNLSVSAGVPLRAYMKAAENVANSGDVIIMPLEYEYYYDDFDTITESYIDITSVDPDIKSDTGIANNVEFLSSTFLRSFTRLNDCMMFYLRSKTSNDSTIYIADSVNEYGDFCLHEGREPTYTNTPRDISFEYNSETMGKICDYIDRMQEKGVKVYITYPTMDKESIVESDKYLSDAEAAVAEYIPAENLIGTPGDFAYSSDYFYDTLYHIQYGKRAEYTKTLYDLYLEKAQG